MLPGPPYAITSTASREGGGSAAMHEIHDRPHGSDVRLGKNAVAEIEDVARPPTGSREDVADLTGTLRGGREQRRGLEIALDRAVSNAGPRGIQRNPPVDANDVAARRGEVLEERRSTRAEVNQRNVRGARERQRLAAVRLHVRAIVVRRQASDPAVERSEEHTSELQSLAYLVCRLLLEKKKNIINKYTIMNIVERWYREMYSVC